MTAQRLLERTWADFVAGKTGRAFDWFYCSAVHRFLGNPAFFSRGWGDLGVVNFAEDARAFEHWPPAHFDLSIEWERQRTGSAPVPHELLEGTFRTPCTGRVYDALPKESRTGRVRLLVPQKTPAYACVLHLAATGDQHFSGRMELGTPLLSEVWRPIHPFGVMKGIATMVLESPFYGKRAPATQQGTRLQRVSDLLVLGRSTVEESLCLLNWATMQGFTHLGMSGFSMGGVHACMVAALYPFPVACTPLLAPRSAADAYCHGALSMATAWQPLLNTVDEQEQVGIDCDIPPAPRQESKDILQTIKLAAQPNMVTAAALRVLQNPRLHQPPPEPSKGNHAPPPHAPAPPNTDPPRQSAAGAATAQSAVTAVSAAGRWLTKDPKPRHADTGNVTAATISSRGEGHMRDAAYAPQGRKSLVTRALKALPKMGGVSASQQARGQRAWKGFRGLLRLQAAESLLQDLPWHSTDAVQREVARLRLEQVLETFTDVTRFPVPQRPEAAVIVGACQDQYVPCNSVQELAEHWQGCELRWVPGGHATAYLLQRGAFRQAIRDSLARLPKQ